MTYSNVPETSEDIDEEVEEVVVSFEQFMPDQSLEVKLAGEEIAAV